MPAITRVGDADISHCSGMTRAQGSPTVFVNGRAISRVGDHNTGHLLPGLPCPAHSSAITAGSSSVFINSLGCGRVGDPTCTAVAEGSHNVFAGG